MKNLHLSTNTRFSAIGKAVSYEFYSPCTILMTCSCSHGEISQFSICYNYIMRILIITLHVRKIHRRIYIHIIEICFVKGVKHTSHQSIASKILYATVYSVGRCHRLVAAGHAISLMYYNQYVERSNEKI